MFPFAASKLHNALGRQCLRQQKNKEVRHHRPCYPVRIGSSRTRARRMQGTFSFHRHAAPRRIRPPKEMQVRSNRTGDRTIRSGANITRPARQQSGYTPAFPALAAARVKSCGFRRNTLLQHSASVFDATIEYLLQLVELRFQLYAFHNLSCFIRRYEKRLKKKNVRIIVRTFGLCFSRSDSESI